MLTTKLCGANEAQRSLRPNERIVSHLSLQAAAEVVAGKDVHLLEAADLHSHPHLCRVDHLQAVLAAVD